MKDVQFFYDPISPYAHLAFAALPQALMGHSVALHYRPVLFAGLLKAHGQLGPAEIPAKRDWTYRQVQWLPAATSPSCCSSTSGTAGPTRPIRRAWPICGRGCKTTWPSAAGPGSSPTAMW